MVILRVGGSSLSYARYLDLLERPDIDKLILVVWHGDGLAKGVVSACKFAKAPETCNSKLEIHRYSYPSHIHLLSRVLSRVQRYGYLSASIGRSAESLINLALRYAPLDILRHAVEVHRPDFIWSGSNDFDGSNVLTWWVAEQKLGLPIVRSYKEHRCRFLIDEKNALLRSKALVLPSQRNIKAFETIYSVKLSHKTVIADEDWRYSKLIQHVRAQKVGKLSSLDGEPHIVILSGRVTYGMRDIRRYSRYNYLSIIKQLIESNVHVHLHSKSIIESTQRPVTDPVNPYVRLATKSQYFHIESPLDLEKNWADYSVLKRYDAGILHNYIENEPIAKFTQINIPNRLYEYQISDVLPIVLKNTMLDVEDITRQNGFGIIASTYAEAAEMLREMVSKMHYVQPQLPIPSFRDFTNSLLSALHHVDSGYDPQNLDTTLLWS